MIILILFISNHSYFVDIYLFLIKDIKEDILIKDIC